METVRPVQPGDLPRFSELLAAARSQGLDQRGGDLFYAFGPGERRTAGPEDPSASLLHWSDGDPDRLRLVGLYEGAVVGIAAGSVAPAPGEGERRLGQIALCYVEPGARQVGVGSALIDELVSWFRSCRCTHVDALALPGDRDTKQLYERAGFKARLLVLNRPLG